MPDTRKKALTECAKCHGRLEITSVGPVEIIFNQCGLLAYCFHCQAIGIFYLERNNYNPEEV